MELTLRQKQVLMGIARQTLTAVTQGHKVPDFKQAINDEPDLAVKAGAFVTLENDKHLRGCVGYIEARDPLYLTVANAAEAAALHDDRFEPVKHEEISKLDIEISVLTPFRKMLSPDEMVIGRDGLYIEQGYHHGLLLPQVATEYGWDRLTFLEQTCRKAGLPSDAWKSSKTTIQIFSALIFNEESLKVNS